MSSMSKNLMQGLSAAAAAATLAMAGAAHADTTWNITGTFNDGGTLTGSVTLDQYDYLLGDFTLTTSGGAQTGFTYTSADSYFSNSAPGSSPFYIDFQPQYYADLHIVFTNDLGVAAPTNLIIGGYQGPSFECQNSYSCPADGGDPAFAIRYLSGEATLAGVPEPASWGLMILGLGAVGATLRLGRRKPVAAVA